MMGSALRLVFHVNKIIPQELFTVKLFGGDLHYQVFLVLVVLCHELLVLLCCDFRGVLQSVGCLLTSVHFTRVEVL